MLSLLRCAIGICLVFVVGYALAAGEKRIALVIGNSAYPGAPLTNPVNDARDMAAALKKLGFEVIEKTNVRQKEMNRAIGEFGGKLRTDSVALFFYAGHGIQVKGKNYLVPIDAQIATEASVRIETVDVDGVLDQLASSPLNIVILDACRNNPFERRFRAIGGGLAQMDAPKGSLIAYATAPGKVASDGTGRNGLYTAELLKALEPAGLKIEEVFKQVRINVAKASGDNQIPWEASSLTGDFYFKAGTQVAQLTPTVMSARTPQQIEDELWDSIKGTDKPSVLEEYLKQYPGGRYVGQARVKLAEMTALPARMEVPPAAPTMTSTSSTITAGQTFRDCQDCPEMVLLPTGIAMSRTPITQKQWRAIMGGIPSQFANCGEDCPVEQVSWNDAQEYIRTLNQRTGKAYRLPKEQEWYAACKAGHETTYCGGDNLDSVAWQRRNSGNTVHPVAQKQPNSWGLYDMSGNVNQWMEDCHNSRCSSRMLRGGSWHSFEDSVRLGSTNGGDAEPSYSDSAIGFRVVR